METLDIQHELSEAEVAERFSQIVKELESVDTAEIGEDLVEASASRKPNGSSDQGYRYD